MTTFYIKHITKYSYSNPVIDGATLIRLHPINDGYQQVISHFISVTNNSLVETYDDFYGNKIGTFLITEPHDELSIISDVEVNITGRLFPDDSKDIKTQWAELNLRKYDANVIDFLKPAPFSGFEEVLNLIQSKKLLKNSLKKYFSDTLFKSDNSKKYYTDEIDHDFIEEFSD